MTGTRNLAIPAGRRNHSTVPLLGVWHGKRRGRELMNTVGSAFVILSGLLCGNARAAGTDFGFESLRQLIAVRSVDSAEQLLAALPEDLRSHYALMFSSRSLQEASFVNPRVILFGGTATLIITFNGDSSQRGFDAVETLEFDATANRFNFREITFGKDGSPPVISAANPPRCTACHESPARPIWDVPPAWPGAYGERYGAGLSVTEQLGMQRFLSGQPAHRRYRYLLDAGALAHRETYVATARANYSGRAVEPANARLSRLLAAQNVRFIVSQLGVKPGFDEHLPAMLAAAGSTCGSVVDFFPADLQAQTSANLQRFAAVVRLANARQTHAKALRQAVGDGSYAASVAPDELNDLRYVTEYGLGASTLHWTLAFERGSYEMRAPAGTLTFEQVLFEWLARTDSELRSTSEYRTFNPGDAYCEHLRRSSRAALAGWYGQHPGGVPMSSTGMSGADSASLSVGVPPPPVLAQCQGCHESGAAPALPFSDPPALAVLLMNTGYAHGRLLDEILFRLTPEAGAARMPRGSNLEAAAQRELESFFLQLAQR